MNRIVVGTVWAFVLLVAGVTSVEAQTPRLGYINSQVIMAEAPGTSEAQVAFEQDMARYRSELERLETELDSLSQAFDRQQATLSTGVRQERQQEIQQKFMEYQQRQQELEQEAQRRQAELVSPIMERISQVIEEIREEGGYAMILDAATGAMITADPSLDLTQQVLQRLAADTP